MLRTVFDVPALNARQQDLEQLAAQPDFWNDQQKAKKQKFIMEVEKPGFGFFNYIITYSILSIFIEYTPLYKQILLLVFSFCVIA